MNSGKKTQITRLQTSHQQLTKPTTPTNEAVETVESDTLYDFSDIEYWFVHTIKGAYNDPDYVEFLTSLNVFRDEGNVLIIPKGDIFR